MENKLYSLKEKIVKRGESKTFDNWKKFANITEFDFLEGLKWLCDDPLTEDGKLTRQLGCHIGTHRVVKLKRVYGPECLCSFYEVETGKLWGGSGMLPNGMAAGRISISMQDRI